MQNIRDLEEYVKNNDIQFIRLCFFDVFGAQRAITIMPQELRRAVEDGISFDAAAIPGFAGEFRSDLFLEPDFDTMTILPWSSFEGSVLRVLCDITYPDRTPFERDSRYLLKQAVKAAEDAGITVDCGTEVEFYIFQTDEEERPTRIPHDDAGYFAVSPADRGENIRREICRMLYDMGIIPEAAHHEQGPGQHEVDFRYGDPLQTADNTTAFKWVVENAVQLSGCAADFSPKPLRDQPGNGMHLNISARSESGEDVLPYFMAGVLAHIREMTLFLNPLKESYDRLGTMEAPGYISWSEQNRSQLIRVPAVRSGSRRFELRSPDPAANPYLACALVIHAGLDGIRKRMPLMAPVDRNLYTAPMDLTRELERLPIHREEAVRDAEESAFIRDILPREVIAAYCGGKS